MAFTDLLDRSSLDVIFKKASTVSSKHFIYFLVNLDVELTKMLRSLGILLEVEFRIKLFQSL